MNKTQIAAWLRSTGARTLAAFSWPARTLARSYGPGKWTARQLLGHLTDCELVFLYRAQLMLSEKEPAVFPFEQDDWAKRMNYVKQDLKKMKQRFLALREALIDLTKTCSPADLARKANRPDNPNYTVGWLVEHAAEHNEHHLEQLAAIKKGAAWTTPPVL